MYRVSEKICQPGTFVIGTTCQSQAAGKVNQSSTLLLLRKYGGCLALSGVGEGQTETPEVRSYFKQAPLRLTEFKFNTTFCVKKFTGASCDDVNKL